MNHPIKTKNIGNIDGDLLFFGGAYSNLQALQALQAWANSHGYLPDHIFCTGDVLGYCAQPAACIELIRNWGIHSIAGNVELQVRNNEDNCGCDFSPGGRCDLFSRNWYNYILVNTSADDKAWLQTLPEFITLKYGGLSLLVLHGSWFHTSAFIFKSTDWREKQKNFDATGADVIVAGHCGLPFLDMQLNKTWLNAGVIGMPANDGSPDVWFTTMKFSQEKLNTTFHKLAYDYTTAHTLMTANKMPAGYAQTLITGIWDNCEILPEAETARQGHPIEL